MNGLHTVLGTGPLGTAVAESLLHRGLAVRVVSRTHTSRLSDVESVTGDLNNPDFARSAVQGSEVVYQCTQPAYRRWTQEFPALQQRIVDATVAAGADLVIGDNLYGYGDPAGAVLSNASPRHPQTRKGLLRKRLADAALAAHDSGFLRVAIARPSNYFGPGYTTGDTVFGPAASGAAVTAFANPDAPHSFSFVPDAGRAMAALGTNDSSWGRAWITPVQPAITQRELARMAWQAAGRHGEPRVRVLGKAGLTTLGLFVPALRELREMSYEFERPFVADSSEFERTFGERPTPLPEAVEATVRWYQQR